MADDQAGRTFAPGDQVTWIYTPRGAYGAYPVNAVVVRVGPKRVLIEAPLRDGGTRQVWVTPNNLHRRDGA